MSQKKKTASKIKKTASKNMQKSTKKPVKQPAKPIKASAVKKPAAASMSKPAAPKSVVPAKPIREKEQEKVTVAPKMKVLTSKELAEYKDALKVLRDRVVDEISFLAGDNLNRSQRDSSGDLSSYSFHMADQGTDNFDREFALNLVSSEQDVLYEIDEALHRIDAGTYGACEMCGSAIEKARLKALPFAKMCISCKSESEKGKTRYRPFGQTITQTSTES
jgi:DnaK suppressor protein